VGLDEEGWALRDHEEDQLVWLDKIEEEYWCQRGRVQWTLKGYSGKAYFHAIANEHRRKCAIPRLIIPTGEVEDQRALMEHMYAFYQGLMGAEGEPHVFGLATGIWDDPNSVAEAENREMELNFTTVELDELLMSINPDSALDRMGSRSSSSSDSGGSRRSLFYSYLRNSFSGEWTCLE
jgi:hypothetical protein